MKINDFFNIKSQKRCAQAGMAIGAVASLGGIFLAAAGEPSAIAVLITGPTAFVFSQKNLSKIEEANPQI